MCELCIVIETQACELWCLVPVRSMYPGSAMLVFLKACFYCCVFMVCVCVFVCLLACVSSWHTCGQTVRGQLMKSLLSFHHFVGFEGSGLYNKCFAC